MPAGPAGHLRMTGKGEVMVQDYLTKLFSLEGKVALVTGGGRGIGQVIARELARAGADIAIFSRSGAAQTAELIANEGGRAVDIIADVTDEEAVRRGMEQIMAEYGRLDIVVNNAGVCYHKDAFEATVEEWRQCIDINLTGEYIVAREAARVMIDRGIRGSIISIASMSGTIVNIPQCQAAYNASKAGVIHMTKSLAIEWIDHGIRVNSISPGYVATPMSMDPDFVEPELMAAWQPLFPMHRMAKPEELTGAVIWLCSESAGYTTGADIIIDGAYTVL